MREFVEDRLPKDVSDHLPREAKTWQRTNGNEVFGKGLARIRQGRHRTRGLMVQYDIMRPYSKGFGDYASDPAITALTEAGVPLTVVTVEPTREVLLDQFLKRAADQSYEEWLDKQPLLKPLRRKIRAALYRLAGKKPKLLKEEQLRVLGLYASENGLRRCLTEWQCFLLSVHQKQSDVHLIYVTPEAPSADLPQFRLLRRV
jgi:hypothetical protein